MKDRIPRKPGRYNAQVPAEDLTKLQSGNPFTITLTRNDDPEETGTPYSKATVLPDSLASAICPGVIDPTPADAFSGLNQKIDDISAIAETKYVESVDEITKSGYYELDVFVDGEAGRFVCNAVVGGGEVRLTGRFGGGTLQYTKADGWEWVAPPMLLFQEYRTTERFYGNPVYAKLINFGYLPANTSGHIKHGISGVDKIVSCTLSFFKNAETYSSPYFENGTIKVYAQANDTYVTVGTTADYSAYTGVVALKYTKK